MDKPWQGPALKMDLDSSNATYIRALKALLKEDIPEKLTLSIKVFVDLVEGEGAIEPSLANGTLRLAFNSISRELSQELMETVVSPIFEAEMLARRDSDQD